MKVKYVILVIALISLILNGCSLVTKTQQEKGVVKKPTERDDFGCWPPSCSTIPDVQGKQACEDWKAGKNIMWPSDCSMMQQSSCMKLCEAEKEAGRSASLEQNNTQNQSQQSSGNEQKQVFNTLPSIVDEEFTSDVADGDKDFVVGGISAMDFYLNDWFGKSTDKSSGLRVDAIPSNDPSIGAQVVVENGKMVILIGTRAFGWNRQIQTNSEMGSGVEWRPKIPAHEYVHVYQFQNGCGSAASDTTISPKWFIEGEAEWLSIKVLREAGWLPQQFSTYDIEVMPSRQISGELKSFETPEQASVDKYPLFTLAIDYLMKDRDIKMLDNFCANIGKGQTRQEAFQNAFGISLDEFYEGFEVYRKTW